MTTEDQINETIIKFKEQTGLASEDLYILLHPSIFKGKLESVKSVDVIENALVPYFNFIIQSKPVADIFSKPLVIDYIKPSNW